MSKKLTVAIIAGGRSAEHEVSLISAKNVLEAIDREKYAIVVIGIDKKGKWFLYDREKFLQMVKNVAIAKLSESSNEVLLKPQAQEKAALIPLSIKNSIQTIDVAFPLTHGPYGEDGTMQGLLKLANIPFVGPSVLGSAVSMDKDITKRLLRDAGIPIAKFLVALSHEKPPSFAQVKRTLGMPVFIKPANLGSSVGVSKATSKAELKKALENAFLYDTKVLIEETIEGREIECSVLGNEAPLASVPGEVVPTHEFYSYEAKYLDENGAALEIPAKLPKKMVTQIQRLAIKTYKVLGCEGMARVDFFLTPKGKLYVNEVNTIPGFTSISMYPKLWEKSGIPYAKLIDTLLELAMNRFTRDNKLETEVR